MTAAPDGRVHRNGTAIGPHPAADARSTRGGEAGRAVRSASDQDVIDLNTWGFQYIQQAPFYQERNPHREHTGTMRDSLALDRHFLTPIVRSLLFATSAFIGVSVTYVLYILMRRRISAYRSPLRNVPGPGGAHWLKGNFTAVPETDSTRLQEEWVRKYGHVLKFQSTLWVSFHFYAPGSSPNTFQYDHLALCRCRNYWPWTLSRSPTFYKIATPSRNPHYYVLVSVFSLVKVSDTVHLRVLFVRALTF